MKKLLGLVVIVALGVFLYLYMNLNSLIKQGVEEYAPQYTQTNVTLGAANISFLSGSGGLSNLVVANPKGYKAAEALSLGALDIKLDIETINSDVIVINSIDIVAPAITYEQGGKAGSNLQQLAKNVQNSTKSSGSKSTDSDSESAKEKKVIIDRLTISNGAVSILTPLTDEPLNATLPTITMTEIGRKTGGQLISEVVKQVMKKISDATSRAANISLNEVKAKLKDAAKAKAKVQDAIKDKVPANFQDQLGGDVGNKSKGLFGN
ncbi:MAG: AsmA family protein [Gammaproteobacteria bacterium]|nr:AsmA family protein [Gammaproteobacteria bacterium]